MTLPKRQTSVFQRMLIVLFHLFIYHELRLGVVVPDFAGGLELATDAARRDGAPGCASDFAGMHTTRTTREVWRFRR
jgi:hypothetical protein